jgi:NADPH-dependent 2,4-dienoyl-CoA reductase/sulfur reductase-like enzyme
MPHAWLPGAQTALLAERLRAVGDGAVVAVSVPFGLMRCPPGPYERAGVIAAWLQRHRKRCKVLLFDSNNHFPKQDAFTAAWDELYPGMIEWFGATDGGAVGRGDARTSSLYTARGPQRVALASVIPRQAAAQLALDAGLSSGRGWCAIDARTFESKRQPQVHVIGDACAAGAMPKAASSAQAQALQCAAAIVAALRETPLPPAQLASVCYSLLARERALSFHNLFEIADGEIRQSPLPLPTRRPSDSEQAQLAARWYREAVARAFAA